MKKIIIFLLLLVFSGCSFICNDDPSIRSFGMSEQQADEVIEEIKQKPDDEKTNIWPRKQKIE